MNDQVEVLIEETSQLTGAAPPQLLEDDAPVLSPSEISPVDESRLYFVGLIGGKDVGKSSLVNAIVGKQISTQTSFGEGTAQVIAYVHQSAEDIVRRRLSRDVPGRFVIVTHDATALANQVLLDLPDIDSHWTEHVQLTRKMLRHLLYPVWIQSVEKYADQQPQQLLSKVAEGNDPGNFVFCLNKADQLAASNTTDAAGALRSDYATRVCKLLSLSQPPEVFLISAIQQDAHDLPALRRLLTQQKDRAHVDDARRLAGERRDQSLFHWLDAQDLPGRASRATRLFDEARELINVRLGEMTLEQAIPRLANDPAQRMWIIEPVMSRRLARWPIVNVIQTTFSPLMSLVRKNLSPTSETGAGLVRSYLDSGPRPLSSLIQASFAHLRQTQPPVAGLFEARKPWLDHDAELAANDLLHRLTETMHRQRDAAVECIAGRGGVVAPLFRWLLTLGALLWFPIAQPILQRLLETGFTISLRDFGLLIVPLLGSAYLLQSAGFLLIYFVALWMILRWDTHRRVNRLMTAWQNDHDNERLNLNANANSWMDDLILPITRQRNRLTVLVEKMQSLSNGRRR